MRATIERYSLTERLVHWVAGLAFVYLLVTGLALFTPLAYWLTTLVGGGTVARAWHPWVGLLYTATLAAMFQLWRRDMRMSAADAAWSRAVRFYIRNEDERMPPAARFNAGQKQFFWAMLLLGALLLVSGLVLWVPAWIGGSWRVLREVAVLVHVVAALVSIGLFIVHVYMGTAVVRGSFDAMISGRVSRSWARAHHQLWLEQVVGASDPSPTERPGS